MSKLSLWALDVAITQLGAQENPKRSNWGKVGDPIPMYLAAVGINFPASWCMAFVYWCFWKATVQMIAEKTAVWIPSKQSYIPMYRTGGVLEAWRCTDAQYKLLPGEASAPQPGDIGIMDLGHGLGHTFIVEKYDKLTDHIQTIEGNTNDTGSREGYEVCRRVRRPSKLIIGYLRF